MKKLAAIFIAALMAASLSACGGWEIEIRNPYDSSSESSSENSEESSLPEQEKEEENEAEKIRVIGVSAKEIDADIINEEGFGFDVGSGIDFRWISETKALLFSYKIEDPLGGSGCSVRIFIYDDIKKEISFTEEFYFDETPAISVYTREQNARIVFSKVFSSFVYSVDYETLESEEWEEDIGIAGVSSNGLFAEIEGGSFAARDVEARENALYVADIPLDYDFADWSPKGGYALLQKGYDGGDYLIVNLAEDKTEKITLNGYAQWCAEEGFIAVYDYIEKRAEIIDLLTGESAETEYLDDVLLYEKDFALFFSKDRTEVLLRDNLTGKVFETGVNFESYGNVSARYNPEREAVLIESAGTEETEIYSLKVYYGKEGEIPEIEPEPEKEPRPDSDFGIEPATAEETEEFMYSEKALDNLSAFASWVGEKDFESPKEVFSSYTLWWFGEELYEAMGGEEALYENEAFFKVDTALAEKYFKRHFGLESDIIKDEYNYDDAAENYKLPVSGGEAPNKFLSAKAAVIGENRVEYTVLLLVNEDETGKTFALTEMICDVIKDSEGNYLRLESNEIIEEFGEASFEDQAKYLAVRIVENLGKTYISNGIRITDSQSVFNFICEMQNTIHLGADFDRRSPYIGEFYKDGAGYHLPVSSMQTLAREIFGIGNFVVSPGEDSEYDEEKKEYVLDPEWKAERNATATDLTTYVSGDIYTVRFTLAVLEGEKGEEEWVIKERYKMNFRLIDGEYLRFLGFDKA